MSVKKFKFVGEPLCKRSCVLNDYGLFCFSIMESFRSGKLVPLLFLSFFLSIILFLYSFFLVPARLSRRLRTLGAQGVAREPRLLIIVGKGGVRSVGMF